MIFPPDLESWHQSALEKELLSNCSATVNAKANKKQINKNLQFPSAFELGNSWLNLYDSQPKRFKK